MPRCQILPLPDYQTAFVIDGIERLRWHFGSHYPRPFFYPLLGPSGQSLTRMGHPGAPDHDHHRSIWFAHEKVQGVNFWTDRTPARIRQETWLAYEDGENEARMAVRLGWYDGHDPKPLLDQELVIAVRPGAKGETFLEVQATFRPTAETLEFGKTNFGFFAVRVAKHIAEHFGGGKLTNSEGATGEPANFAKPARWIDYSTPTEGITYFDHPSNPGQPTSWHVRSDGWMAAAPCLNGPLLTKRSAPLALRYLVHGHHGPINPDGAKQLSEHFGKSAGFVVAKAAAKHVQFETQRHP